MTAPDPRRDATALLLEWRQGDKAALQALIELVYPELRKIARARLRGERNHHTLQTTGLVHEAYLRLVRLERMTLESRAHFLAMAARLMRQILVDHARRKSSRKRGGSDTVVGLEEVGSAGAVQPQRVDVLALDEALNELSRTDPRLGRVVELRSFGGLTLEETAQALGVSHATVERDWAIAKSWLFQRLTR